MINHARTLLLNVPSAGNHLTGDEQFIEPEFKPIRLPNELGMLRALLFGTNPDRFTLNYRAAQYMTIMHRIPWVDKYLKAVDSRITYENSTSLYRSVTSTITCNSPASITDFVFRLTSGFTGNDAQGVNLITQILSILGSQATVDTTPYSIINVTTGAVTSGNLNDVLTTASGGSYNVSPLQLVGVPNLIIGHGTVLDGDATWMINLQSVPSRGIPEVFSAISSQVKATEILFKSKQEPYQTFWNAFQNAAGIQEKLSAILLALIYRTEELRNV